MDVHRLWIGAPLIVVGAILLASILTGKTINPASGTDPLIVSRSEHPGRYWVSVVGFGLVFLLWGWLTLKVITAPV